MAQMNRRAILVTACLVFFGLGMVTAALGPVLPDLAERAGSDLATIGSVFTMIFFGALLAQAAAGPIGDRLGMHRVLLVGLLMMAAGTLGLALSTSLAATLGLAFAAGLGHGAVDLGANVWIAAVFERRSVSALNVLNVFFGLGAFAGPAIAGLSLNLWGSGLPALWVGAAGLAAVLPFLLRMRPGKSEPVERPDEYPVNPGRSNGLYGSALLWGLGFLILTYVGTENGVGGWTTTYVARTTALSLDQAALAASGFWLALTGGRVVSALVGLRLQPQDLLAVSLTGAAAGGALLVGSMGNAALTILATLLLGFSFGAVYPTTIAITTARFQQGPGKAAGLVAAMGSVGGMALPWLQGILLERVRPAASAWFTLAGACALFALALIIRAVLNARDRKTPSS